MKVGCNLKRCKYNRFQPWLDLPGMSGPCRYHWVLERAVPFLYAKELGSQSLWCESLVISLQESPARFKLQVPEQGLAALPAYSEQAAGHI